jgi:integrase
MPKKRRVNKHLPERVYQKHNAYYYVDLQNKWHRLGKTLPEAMQKWTELIDAPRDLIYMQQIFDRYMLEVAPLKADSTYKGNMEQVRPLRAVFGHLKPHEIKPTDVYRYLDERGKKAPTAANREKELLSHVFSMAIRWGIVTENPCKSVRRLHIKKHNRYIEDWELLAVREYGSPLLKLLIDFAYLTGLRRGDILSVKQSDLTDEGIEIDVNKTGQKILIEWSDALRKIVAEVNVLHRTADLGSQQTLFRTRKGAPYTGEGISAMWQRLITAALENGIIQERFTFHDIRRKAATDAEKQLGREYARQLLGHTTQQMTARYISGVQKVKPLR